MFSVLSDIKMFSVLDLRNEYYHIVPDEVSKLRLAFFIAGEKYEFKTVPIGLYEAPAIFFKLI